MKEYGWLFLGHIAKPLLNILVLVSVYLVADEDQLDGVMIAYAGSLTVNAFSDFGLRHWLTKQVHDGGITQANFTAIFRYGLFFSLLSQLGCFVYLFATGIQNALGLPALLIFALMTPLHPPADLGAQILRGKRRFRTDFLFFFADKSSAMILLIYMYIHSGTVQAHIVALVLLACSLSRVAATSFLLRPRNPIHPSRSAAVTGIALLGERWLAGINIAAQTIQLRWPLLLLPFILSVDGAAELALGLSLMQAFLTLPTALASFFLLGGDRHISERYLFAIIVAISLLAVLVLNGFAAEWIFAILSLSPDNLDAVKVLFYALPPILLSQYFRNQAAMQGQDVQVAATLGITASAAGISILLVDSFNSLVLFYLAAEVLLFAFLAAARRRTVG